MPSNTPNYTLKLYDRTTDTGEYFIDYRDDIAGSATTSNMYRIDTQMKVNADGIATKVGKTTADITYYVNGSTGSDITGDGTTGNPFATIQHTVDLIPKNIQNTVLISVSNGTYAETVTVQYFSGGSLSITSTGGLSTINALDILNCTAQITITSFKTTASDTISMLSAHDVYFVSCEIRPASYDAGNGFNTQNKSNIHIYQCVVDNCTQAIYAEDNSTILVESTTGTGNQYSYACHSSLIYLVSSTVGYTVDEELITGSGIISPFTLTGVVTAASVLTDNAITRGDGGAEGIQTTSVLINDTNDVSGMNSLTLDEDKLLNFGDTASDYGYILWDTSFPGGGLYISSDTELQLDAGANAGLNGIDSSGVYVNAIGFWTDGSQAIIGDAYDSDEYWIIANSGGSVELYYDGSKKFETTAEGINVIDSISLNGTDIDDIYTPRDEWGENGFENTSDSTLTWTDSTPDRTLSIQPTATSFNYWMGGIKYTSTGDTVQITDTTGIHFIYYDGTNLTSVANPNDGQMGLLIRNNALVSLVYWNSTAGEAIYVGEERHGKVMSPSSHQYHHFKDGLVFLEGLGLNTIDSGGGGSTAEAQFGVSSGGVTDEDLYQAITAVGATTGLPIYYMTGSSADWNKTIVSGFSARTFDNTSATRLARNEYTGGAWQLTEVSNNDFVLCHVFATTEKDSPMIAVMGQNEYTTRNNARDGAQEEILSLYTTGLPSAEFRVIATVIFKTNLAYASAINATVQTADTDVDYVDWRDATISRVALSTSDHNSLTGLELADTGIIWGHINDQAQTIYGTKTFADGLSLGDDEAITFGDGSDATIKWNTVDTVPATFEIAVSGIMSTKATTKYTLANTLYFYNNADTTAIITASSTSGVLLYYTGSKKFETTATGVTVTGTIVADGLTLGDDERIYLGSGETVFIESHSTGYLRTGAGTMQIHQAPTFLYYTDNFEIKNAGGEEIIDGYANGAVNLYYDNVKRLETTATGVTVTGTIVSDGLTLGDSENVLLGVSSDFQFVHDGTDNVITTTGANIYIKHNTESMLKAVVNGGIELYYNGTKKLETTNTGVVVSGDISATLFKQGNNVVDMTTATKTLALADDGKFILCKYAGTMTVTVPTTVAEAFSIGAEISFHLFTDNTLTFVGASGVTVVSPNAYLDVVTQYSTVTLKKISSSYWTLVGGEE